MRPVLVNGEWRPSASSGSFHAVDPASGADLPDEYPVSAFEDLEEALQAAALLVDHNPSVEPERLAAFLEAFTLKVEARREEVVDVAHRETALPPEPRLRSVELPRMLDQLRQASTACRKRSWCRATIDTRLDIRSMYGPLGGPVVIFSPNNFPLAFNSLGGGDFAAAIAAGNPVIAKANPGHPGTTRVLAEAAFEALVECEMPRALVQLLYHFRPEDGLRLAAHHITGAISFTGSRASGLELKAAADRAGTPVYLEMSSANPVVILPGALEERPDELARDLVASCTAGAGQFCTKPALVIVIRDDRGERFFAAVSELLARQPPGILLGADTLRRLESSTRDLQAAGAALATGGCALPPPGFRFANTLLRVTGRAFLERPAPLQTEAFGSVTLFVFAEDPGELEGVVRLLAASLTGTICSDSAGSDDRLYRALEPLLRRRVGRLLNDRMPTGVAVSPAMNHGGPYPAAGHPGFTAVGFPASILRFAALWCYDHVRPDRLPPELRDANPTGTMWRLIDGEYTRKSL